MLYIKLNSACLKIAAVLLLLSLSSCSYRHKLKASNIEEVVMLVADNYKIMQEGSRIKISFLKPYDGSQKLGDPNVFEYDKPRFEATGEYKLNEQLPQAIADFCRKYKISEITVYYRENGPHKVPVIEFEKEPQGFPYSNYNIIYAKEDNIS